jgi:hypothetical protein
MIVNDKDAAKRLASPMNLINRLKSSDSRNSAMSLFGIGKKKDEFIITEVDCIKKEITIESSFNPFSTKEQSSSLVPSVIPSQVPLSSPQSEGLDNILENHESQIKLGLAHDKALDLLNRSVEALSLKLDDVKADRLPAVISAASKTVESIRRERSEAAKNGKDREVHYHFYTPVQKRVADYEVIDVTA